MSLKSVSAAVYRSLFNTEAIYKIKDQHWKMSKKTTIEDAIAMLGFATTPVEKVKPQQAKKEAASPKGRS